MIPANHRSMARTASQSRICTAALYSVAGMCRCPKCNPDAVPPAASAAAVRVIAPPAADGGNSPLTPDALVVRASDPAADRNLPLSGDPVGGLFDEISAAPYPAPKPLAAARLPNRECSPGGGPFLQERDA